MVAEVHVGKTDTGRSRDKILILSLHNLVFELSDSFEMRKILMVKVKKNMLSQLDFSKFFLHFYS